MSQHKVPIRVAEDVVAEVWRYDDWSGNSDISFFKDGQQENPDPLCLPGEWLVKLGKKRYKAEATQWLIKFVDNFINKEELPVIVSASWNQTIYHNPQTRTEVLLFTDHPEYKKAYLSCFEDWSGEASLQYYGEREQFRGTWDIPCAWILAIARVAYWEILGKAFISAAERAEQQSPESRSYAWQTKL